VPIVTDVPDDLLFRGIEPAKEARGFRITLDTAEPFGDGRIEGRVERRGGRSNRRPLTVEVQCVAAWLDVAPQLVGKKRLLSLSSWWDIRSRMVPIWLEEGVFVDRRKLDPLDAANWRPFEFLLPAELPRAIEGTFASFRWRLKARRARALGSEVASLPLLLVEPQTLPVVRIETTPIGSWRLLEWRSETETGGSGGPCLVAFEERRPEDMPLRGETREEELARRSHG
jgi:hypothetical protein